MPSGARHPQVPLPSPGVVVAGKYEVTRVLGEGGMGVVFEANHLRLRKHVALKMLLPEMLEHQDVVSRFEREARAAVQLKSRHVAKVMDVDQTADGLPYMVMELLEGHDLEAEIGGRRILPFEEAVDYVLQACAGMAEAHQAGIVHRDLKPSNLFLALDEGRRTVKILDFGISKVQDEADAKLTSPHAVMGTAMYMSPEQVRSSRSVDERSDVWALGVILYELLAGQAPWVGTATQVAAAIVSEDPPPLVASAAVPGELVQVLMGALRRKREERYPDVRAFALALQPFAPIGSLGRAFADAVANGASGSFARTSIHSTPSLPSLASKTDIMGEEPTLAQPPAMGSGRIDGGTAPGWAKPSTSSRSRAALGAALAMGVLLLAATLAYVFRSERAPRDVAAASSGAPSAPASHVVEVTPVESSAIDPRPPTTGEPATTAPVETAATHDERPSHAASTAKAVKPKPPVVKAHPKRPKAPATPAAKENPLHL